MEIKIKLKKENFEKEILLNEVTSLEEIAQKYAQEYEFEILAAKVNNEMAPLSTLIAEDCVIEFLDIRNTEASFIYQNSLIMLYLKAVDSILGRVPVEIGNPINKGIYTKLHTENEVSEAEVEKIQQEMERLVKENHPFVIGSAKRQSAIDMMKEYDSTHKMKLVKENENIHKCRYYTLDGYRNFIYSYLLPSTGYLKLFSVSKYRDGILLKFPTIYAPDKLPIYTDEEKLFDAFEEAERWCSLMGVSFACDLNDTIKADRSREMVLLSEALHEKKIAKIADEICKSGKRLILIAGPSSSGKTTFAQRLCTQLKVNGVMPLYLATDDYFVERENTPRNEKGELDFECLEAVDIELFNSNMEALLKGEIVDLPRFDFINGKKIFGKRLIRLDENRPIVIEGIHALNESLTPHFRKEEKFKIYISPLTQINIDLHNRISTTDARLLRRIVRDNMTRGNSAEKTILSWNKVRMGEEKYIFPYSNEADVIFNSVHIYELAVLKKYIEPLLKEITIESSAYSEASRLLKLLQLFMPIEEDYAIPNNSILREFIGGSIYYWGMN